MKIGRGFSAGCCACAVCAGLTGEFTLAILSDVSDCLKYKLPGICREWRQGAILPENFHPETTSTGNEVPRATEVTTATGTNFAFQPGIRSL